MKEFYELKAGVITPCTDAQTSNIVVYCQPSELEKKELHRLTHLDHHGLESALDPDEISRVEFTPEHTYIIWKRPNSASLKDLLKFEVSSMGFVLKKDKLILILNETEVFQEMKMQGVCSLNGVVLKMFYHTTHHFLGHLKVMRQINSEVQSKLNLSLENRYFIQMFNLSESLIYYLNALETNSVVLSKLRLNVEKLGLSKEETDMLDDVIIDHQQCTKQTEIYSSILSGLMDARGSIINNNMNVLLRNLTMINIVFLPLNLIAGVGGMSEYTRLTEGIMDWRLAYGLFFIVMTVLGVLTWAFLMNQINKQKDLKPSRPLKKQS